MIGGVAGALARRFKVKPLVARVLLLLVTLTGWGLAIYLALWYLMPLEARPPSNVRAGPTPVRTFCLLD